MSVLGRAKNREKELSRITKCKKLKEGHVKSKREKEPLAPHFFSLPKRSTQHSQVADAPSLYFLDRLSSVKCFASTHPSDNADLMDLMLTLHLTNLNISNTLLNKSIRKVLIQKLTHFFYPRISTVYPKITKEV